jgi:protein SCO1/2
MKRSSVRVFVIVAAIVAASASASAQMTGGGQGGYKREAGMTASSIPAPLREIGFDQHIGAFVPLETPFRDESGKTVRLGDYFGTRPVVMVFAYYNCPMLCTQVISGLTSALRTMSLEPGKDFEIVTVSFDPHDTPQTASEKKAIFIERYKREGAASAWHFLSGDPASIDRLTKAAGFRYVWDAETKQFAHPTGVIVLTPDGRLAKYMFGIEYGPRDLRFAIVEASNGRVGNAVDALLLYCYHYDPMTGRYGLVVLRMMRIAGAATVLALAAFIAIMLRREKRSSKPIPNPQSPLPSGVR